MEGNDKGECSDDFNSSFVEMDVYETSSLGSDGLLPHGKACIISILESPFSSG